MYHLHPQMTPWSVFQDECRDTWRHHCVPVNLFQLFSLSSRRRFQLSLTVLFRYRSTCFNALAAVLLPFSLVYKPIILSKRRCLMIPGSHRLRLLLPKYQHSTAVTGQTLLSLAATRKVTFVYHMRLMICLSPAQLYTVASKV